VVSASHSPLGVRVLDAINEVDNSDDESAIERFFRQPEAATPRPPIGVAAAPMQSSMYPKTAGIDLAVAQWTPGPVFHVLARVKDRRRPRLADCQHRLDTTHCAAYSTRPMNGAIIWDSPRLSGFRFRLYSADWDELGEFGTIVRTGPSATSS
jgi:hypothetical protein